jgi:hypothetical protein
MTPLEPLWLLVSSRPHQVDTLSNTVLPSQGCKQGSSSGPRTSPDDASGVGIGRQEVAERQQDSIRRLFGGRPDAQKLGAQGGASV